MDALDKLLSQIKAESENEQTQQQIQKPNIFQSLSPPEPKSLSLIDNLLSEVQADIAAQDAELELRKQQQLEQARLQQEQIKAKQKDALKQQAKDWLEKLDPFSPEGLWFERFAESYSSKLEAAIEYLQTN
ncbi:hypothetical protein NOS3756_36630 [Nostoc sp. NIES-3756]|uniref:salt stress protein, Slr1339 family n=1 Tax=Nostoc sp. NIES-3756 TaxID=1751286 RepID=UPI00071F2BE7|nr:hypothetical protein [Nostoc sp. NIES-3756]BAT54691.1 hypothetical protein NOS3756_36630 [Nostoc sp. NIES-3756]